MIAIETVAPGHSFRPLRLPGQRPNALEQFVAFPREGLPLDPGRVPLLDVEQADLVDRRGHPFYQPDGDVPAGEAELFLARRDDRIVGRVAAVVNHQHNAFEGVRQGFFGFYEALDDQAIADALLGAAEGWLRQRGMAEMLGPASPTHNYYYGSRVRSEEPAPSRVRFLEADNPDYYNRHFQAYGLESARRLFGYDADLDSPEVARVATRFERTIRETIDATGMRIRPLDLGDFEAEITRANELINRSLAENWGFSPMTRAELAYMGRQMRLLIDPRLVLFVELEARPVGISLAVPDYNELFTAMNGRLGGWPAAFQFGNLPIMRWAWPHGNAWATRSIDSARVIALGVLPTVWRDQAQVRREMVRLGPALIFATFENLRRAGYHRLTASWILEDNTAMLAPFKLVGLQPARVWKIYRKPLA
ncbi:MAG TPA: hypothetical protein VGL23_14345 [Chloroflexota bacterium]